MKIALVSPYSWTAPGGVNGHIASLAEHLRARGHQATILAPADGPVGPGVIPLGRTLGVPFNGSVARITIGPRVRNRVRVALRRTQPDVIHIHEPFSPSASLLALQAARAPVVTTFHAALDSRVYRAAGIQVRRWARKITVKIAVSAAARNTVESIIGAGVRIIPNGIDGAAYADVAEVDAHGKTILYFGRLEKRKGPQILVEAIPAILAAHPEATIVIAGEGPLRRELEDAVPPVYRGAVSFIGSFSEGARSSLLASASVAVLPAIGGESFGIVLLEAMAAGRPVVASAIPGFAAVVDHGEQGLLFPPGQADALAASVARLLDDPAEITRMGAAGRDRAARYDWGRLVVELEEVYREAMGGRPGVAAHAR